MILVNVKMAIAALMASKVRTFLTMLGVIIGVLSVITIISLGEGLKANVKEEITSFGNDIFQVSPGKSLIRDEEGKVTGANFFASLASNERLTERDLNSIRKVEGVKTAAPIMAIDATLHRDDKNIQGATVAATDSQLISFLQQKVERGQFLVDESTNKNTVILGKSLAEEIFGMEDPLGKKIKIRSTDFIVGGVLTNYDSTLGLGPVDLNRTAYIPLEAGRALTKLDVAFIEIDVKVEDYQKIDAVIYETNEALKANRDGDDLFTIAKPEEFIAITDDILNIITRGVSAIAFISLIVGSIGIMNIMFASVSERTHEIGIRKSIGATNRQILAQFLTEAIVISLLGAAIGIGLSLVVGLIVEFFSVFSPKFSFPLIAATAIGSLFIGVVSGIAPAVKAARKDPVESLRHE